MGPFMPHLNHRRGDTRHRVKRNFDGRWIAKGIGHWNRIANKRLRSAVSQVLQGYRSCGYVDLEDAVFPLAREADSLWNYD